MKTQHGFHPAWPALPVLALPGAASDSSHKRLCQFLSHHTCRFPEDYSCRSGQQRESAGEVEVGSETPTALEREGRQVEVAGSGADQE